MSSDVTTTTMLPSAAISFANWGEKQEGKRRKNRQKEGYFENVNFLKKMRWYSLVSIVVCRLGFFLAAFCRVSIFSCKCD